MTRALPRAGAAYEMRRSVCFDIRILLWKNPWKGEKKSMKESGRGLLRKYVLMALVFVLSLCGLLFLVAMGRILVFYNDISEAKKIVSPTVSPRPVGELDTVQELYLDLLKVVLTRYGLQDRNAPLIVPESRIGKLASPLFRKGPLPLYWRLPFDPNLPKDGTHWPRNAETLIGLIRLDNLQYCIEDVLRRNVPGDLIECGAWRGGACIFMRAVLHAHGNTTRRVWVADSFEGLPEPEEGSEDAALWEGGEFAVSLEQVKANFSRYGLLDDQVRFLKGFFIDTLPKAPIGKLAVLRVDADLYESTTQSLEYLYDKVSVGGYVIVDDYGDLSPAKKAVDDFRNANGITEEIVPIDWTGIYWQKQR